MDTSPDKELNNPDISSDSCSNKMHDGLMILYEVSNAMRTTLDLDHILHIILTGVTAHTGLGFNRAILFLINNKERCLEPRIAIGPGSGEDAERIWNHISQNKQRLDDLIDEHNIEDSIQKSPLLESLKDFRVPLVDKGNNLLARAYKDGSFFHISHNQIYQYSNDILLQRFKTTELVIMPLKAKDKVNGIIIADNLFTQKAITEDILKIFTMLANQAGLAIENSRLYEMVKYKSHTDALTGLWNHGYFQERLARDISYVQNNKTKTSLLMLDIDNFKKFNDIHGHQNGDKILKEISNILRTSSRDNDHVCRYGGEEFAIILNETDKIHAQNIAERLRLNIEQHSFPKFSSNEHLHITVSIGVATYPDDSETKEELILRADQSMYIAKFSGKNRVCSS